jgi:hypothetical protein
VPSECAEEDSDSDSVRRGPEPLLHLLDIQHCGFYLGIVRHIRWLHLYTVNHFNIFYYLRDSAKQRTGKTNGQVRLRG